MTRRRLELWLVLALAAATLTAYAPLAHNEFVDFDDDLYVTDNAQVQAGLTWDGVRDAFAFPSTRTQFHPLSWISLMVDRTLLGPGPAGFHLVNLAMHLGSVLVLFVVLAQSTGQPWPSAGVALLFAVHPMQVESVAWAAERKHVLSTLLGLLAILTYLPYARRGGRLRYAGVAALLTLSLLAKPMFVILPVLLLLLDLWPLARTDGARGKPLRLVVEKIPLAVLGAASTVLAVLSNEHPATLMGRPNVPWPDRLANAAVSWLDSLVELATIPALGVFHPFPDSTPWPRVALGAGLLGTLTAVAVSQRKRRPWACVGWLWFLVALLPMAGLVQAGLWPARADRFVYVPMIGLAIVLCFGSAEAARGALRTGGQRAAAAVIVGAVTLVLIARTRAQVRTWQDSVSLWRQAAAAEAPDYVIQYNFGTALGRAGRLTEAAEQLREATRLDPRSGPARNQLGNVLLLSGDVDGAIGQYRSALALQPDNLEAAYNLARLLDERGQATEAAELYRRFLEKAGPAYRDARLHTAQRLSAIEARPEVR